jgi:hypothetical protein
MYIYVYIHTHTHTPIGVSVRLFSLPSLCVLFSVQSPVQEVQLLQAT